MFHWIRIAMLLAWAVFAMTGATAVPGPGVLERPVAERHDDRSVDDVPGQWHGAEDPADDPDDDDDARDGASTTSWMVLAAGPGNTSLPLHRRAPPSESWEIGVFRPPIA